MRRSYRKIFKDPEKLQEMLDLYEAGVTLVELGRKYGCDHTSILYRVMKAGVYTSRIVRRPGTLSTPSKKLLKARETRRQQVAQQVRKEAEHQSRKRNPIVGRYDDLMFEMTNAGKSYGQYRREAERRSAGAMERRLEILHKEKEIRDALIRKGELIPVHIRASDDGFGF